MEQEIHVLQCTSNLMTMCTAEHVAALSKMSTPINVGTFLKYHIEISRTIAEKGRELIYHVKHQEATLTKRKTKGQNIHFSLNFQQNWMGKNKEIEEVKIEEV